jgi:hypothetical protein
MIISLCLFKTHARSVTHDLDYDSVHYLGSLRECSKHQSRLKAQRLTQIVKVEDNLFIGQKVT